MKPNIPKWSRNEPVQSQCADAAKFYRAMVRRKKSQLWQSAEGSWKNDGWIKWHMNFTVCEVIHKRKNNPHFAYRMMGSELAIMIQKRDLGIVINSSVEMSAQSLATVKKANRTENKRINITSCCIDLNGSCILSRTHNLHPSVSRECSAIRKGAA